MSSVSPPRSARSASPPTGKRMSLSDITKKATALPSRTIVYGSPGIGKTELGASFPEPIFLMTQGETGLLTLMQSGRISETSHFPQQAKTWQDVLDAVDVLTEGEHPHKTFVLDALNGAERLVHEFVCKRDFGGDFGEKGFQGYQRGYAVAIGEWRDFLFRLDKLREVKRMGILALCHTAVRSTRNPLGSDYDCFTPALHAQTWNVTVGWSDMVLFARQEVYLKEEKGKRTKGVSGERVFLTEGTAAYEAKNRMGLPPEISMGTSGHEAYHNLIAAAKQGRRITEEAVPVKSDDEGK